MLVKALLLGQLVYTSFPKIGFKILASEQVSTQIQQAFFQRVVLQYWDAYNRPSSEYRGIYLLQVTLEYTLFGWLYADGADDLGRDHIPYFICYYLAEPLYAFQLENIFTCLHKGPVALIDRDSFCLPLEPMALPDLWRYQPARPGVEIPWIDRKRIHTDLRQGELLDLFISVDEQKKEIELNEQVQAQKFVAEEKNADDNSLPTIKNSILLLGIAIGTATSLAVILSVYGFFQRSILVPNHPELSSSEISPVFYKTLAEVPNVPQGLFNYTGSSTFIPLQSRTIVFALKRAQPQFQLNLVEPIDSVAYSSIEIEMLLAGEFDFVQSSLPIKNTDFLEAKEHGFTLEQIPIATEGIVFFVNPQVFIPGLSLSQVRDIFTGKIKNWKEVGGSDLEITPFSNSQQSRSTTEILNEKVLSGGELGPTVQKVKNSTESVDKVANTPGSIGYSSVSEVIGQKAVYPLPLSREAGQPFVPPYFDADKTAVNKTAFANGSYPLARKLFVIIKRDGKLDEQAGLAYVNLLLTDEGQQLVEQVGFVPIR